MFSKKCQHKVYDIKLQIITELSIPITSPINAATNTNLVFLTPTTLVYNVVSVEPMIVDAINPQFTIDTILLHNVTSYSNRSTSAK